MFNEIEEWMNFNKYRRVRYIVTDSSSDREKYNIDTDAAREASIYDSIFTRRDMPDIFISFIPTTVNPAKKTIINKTIESYGTRPLIIFYCFRQETRQLNTFQLNAMNMPNIWCIFDYFLCPSRNSNFMSINSLTIMTDNYPTDNIPELSRMDITIFDLKHDQEVRDALIFKPMDRTDKSKHYVYLRAVLATSHYAPTVHYNVVPYKFYKGKH